MTPEQQAILDKVNARLAEQQAATEQANKRLELQRASEPPSVMGGDKPERNVLDVMKQSAIKGGAGLVDIPAGFGVDVANLWNYFTNKNAPVPQKYQPVTEFLKEKNVIVPEREPNTPFLKGVDFTTQLATSGGINPVTVGKSLLTKTLPQAGKDIAGQFGRTAAQGAIGSMAMQGMEHAGVTNPLALAAGTMLPMGVVGGISSLRGTPSSITNEALKSVTPEQLKMADMLLKQSYANGAPLTGAEAIAQVTGQNPLQNVQRVVEGSQRGGAITSPFMAQRPDQNAQYLQNTLNQISPLAGSSQVPVNLQKTAKNVVDTAENSLTQKVSPNYQAASSIYLPEADLATLTSNPKIADAINAVTKTSKYGVKGADPRSIQTLIQAKHFLTDELSNQLNPMSSGLEKNAARVTTIAEKELSDFLKTKSPDYAKGSSIYQNAQQTQIQPLKQSGVGIMAEQTGTPAELMTKQREQLMPANPIALYPQDIKRTVDLLRRKDPNLVPQWTAQNLEGIFNETAQNLQTGANQYGGAKFASAITGNPQQKENLRTLITEASGPQAWQGFETMLDVMGAQGKRQPIGSQTAFNAQMQGELKTGGLTSVPKSIANPLSSVRNWIEDFRYGKNTEQLARLLTDPDSVNLLKRLSKTDPHTQKAQAIVDTLAGGSIASKPQEKE